jgi:hypothetical protein
MTAGSSYHADCQEAILSKYAVIGHKISTEKDFASSIVLKMSVYPLGLAVCRAHEHTAPHKGAATLHAFKPSCALLIFRNPKWHGKRHVSQVCMGEA